MVLSKSEAVMSRFGRVFKIASFGKNAPAPSADCRPWPAKNRNREASLGTFRMSSSICFFVRFNPVWIKPGWYPMFSNAFSTMFMSDLTLRFGTNIRIFSPKTGMMSREIPEPDSA